jgi:phosphohistidine phosphatase
MIIYFLRHANAGERLANQKKDQKRGLDKAGIEQCGLVGRALAALDVHIDMLISSPLKRAVQTASLVGNELSYEGKLQMEAALRPDASFADFRSLLEKYAKVETLMIVGHSPSLKEFLGRLISEAGCEATVDLKKGAVAKVETGRNSAALLWSLPPKVLREIYDAATESSRPKTSRK